MTVSLHLERVLNIINKKFELADIAQINNRSEQKAHAKKFIAEALDTIAAERARAFLPAIDSDEEERISDEVLATLFGLGPLEKLLADDTVENISVNGCDTVWVHHTGGVKRRADAIANSDEELIALISRAAARLGRNERRFDIANPFLDLQLPDRSRLNAVMAVSERPAVSIRRHRHQRVSLNDLCKLNAFDSVLQDFLNAAVNARMSIIVSGGTNAGKTTLLRALLNACDPSERLITIEDRLELALSSDPERHWDVIELETRTANIEESGEITMQQLVRNALAMSPDRLVVGEVRGPEVIDMLAALSTGNDGSMCTIHANSSQAAFSKIATYALRSAEQLPVEATNRMIAESINLVVHLEHNSHGDRKVKSVREVIGTTQGAVNSIEIFTTTDSGVTLSQGQLQPTTYQRLNKVGFNPAEYSWLADQAICTNGADG
ncbi:MAG: CpaF family protein [Acidimicrobiia bacterium]|nr:CpaF family protein [Acidimicrobiia bacterium]MYC57541.1 CpaF family protein [Acidimicrobiia bacterium]MYG94832.1 CpaF family protein [Acidimicrobiia bacterium]MYI30095.1 CpaF family protein [Acidimicrobiia bacterium]